jgi:nicotinamide-nucleotide amidase
MPDLISDIFSKLKTRGGMIATAESCTGGLIAAAITAVPGSSEFFDRGFITYSNEAKMQMLGVPEEILNAHGAVSEETARAMVDGVFRKSRAHLAVSVTGIAGPGGGSEEKPVGLVYIGYGVRDGTVGVARHQFDGDRSAIREKSAAAALHHALSLLE